MSETVARRRQSGPDAQEIRGMLVENYERLAAELTGTQPERRRNTHEPLRFPHMGGFEIHTHGPKAGVWYSFSEGKGGGPFEMVQHFRGGDFKESLAFARGWLGISRDARPTPSDPLVQAAREAARAKQVAEAAEDREKRLGYASKLWGAAQPVEATVAERYLTETRGIPRPDGGWPGSVAFHPQRNALMLAATNDAGELRGVHLVHLTPDAQKIGPEEIDRRQLRAAKMSFGLITEGVIRLPGDAAGPVLQGEGPETGLSAWAATRYETRLALTGAGRIVPDDGRRTVILRDDDKPGSPADRVIEARIGEWRDAGKDVSSAFPWDERRGDKSDINDAIRAGGAEVVRARIGAALTSEVEKMPSDYQPPDSPAAYGAPPGPSPEDVAPAISDGGQAALSAVHAKIDHEWANRSPDEREQLKAEAVKSMASHEAENGDVSLTPEQRRAALRESNTTRANEPAPGVDLERAASVVWIKNAEREPVRDKAPEPDRGPSSSSAMAWRDSDAVLRSYIIENRPNARLYFKSHKDADPAIIAAENKIQGAQGDAKTVRSMLDIADARGWKELEVGGGKQYAQELWIEAKARGIKANGYEATERDHREADRRAAQRTIRETPDPSQNRDAAAQQPPERELFQSRSGGKGRVRNR